MRNVISSGILSGAGPGTPDENGYHFTNHQNTANVCTPSRSVMYTGLHMPHTRMFDNLGFPG
ncbi:sulfatase-like hydrolase/transferase [Klebsiella pneumoniae]|uniref:Sulfatase-like hydrolase/transferase n=1 Tax=Klebsiella pneumoniae TaxID=573 RepID=A0A927HWN7_KLEPN|nr:sulfatase-like hydrolase/transferase [Klebsiella pneumoniae]